MVTIFSKRDRENRAIQLIKTMYLDWKKDERKLCQTLSDKAKMIFPEKDSPAIFIARLSFSGNPFLLFSFKQIGEQPYLLIGEPMFRDTSTDAYVHWEDNVGHFMCLIFGDIEKITKRDEEYIDTLFDLEEVIMWGILNDVFMKEQTKDIVQLL